MPIAANFQLIICGGSCPCQWLRARARAAELQQKGLTPVLCVIVSVASSSRKVSYEQRTPHGAGVFCSNSHLRSSLVLSLSRKMVQQENAMAIAQWPLAPGCFGVLR